VPVPVRYSRGMAVFGDARLTRPLWPHQEKALAKVDLTRDATYLVVPPGGGKTLIGLEAARRIGRRALVLCPNTAIQAQWLGQWRASFATDGIDATVSRDLPTPLTVLTYQAVYADSAIHPEGTALLSRLRECGPVTLILDECHHLLEVWGRVLREVAGRLDHPHLVGLTATPPHLMTADQAQLHRELFGEIDIEISVPSLVRDGRLAPYQELAYFTVPTPAEAGYIRDEALRFAELRTDLMEPGFASTPFLGWLDARVVERRSGGAQVSWQRFEKDEPALAGAALRLHVAGLLARPEGARLREEHRRPLDAADWTALIGDYVRHCLAASGDPRDQAACEAIRRALPSVGYLLTKTGIRAAESPIDRVLARSESKVQAVIEIVQLEAAELGSQLRALVLCEFESAGGMIPARLAGVMDPQAGGAFLALTALLESTPGLDPVLLTGQHVACGPETAERLLDWLPEADTGLSPRASQSGPLVEVSADGGWEPRRYVPLITRFFTEGGTRCLVGTRALLGEGWDAPVVNVVVDVTTATTPTSVVQVRGRALRLDPAWPGKVADNWAVVCVTDQHPKGAADYSRFVRKHDRYFALSGTGDIISGVAHVDPGLSPWQPPAPETFSSLNAAMLIRAQDRATTLERWAIGQPYADEPVATLTVTTRRPLTEPPAAAPAKVALARTGRWPSASLEDMAMATADALQTAGLVTRGADSVRIEVLADGGYRARLADVAAVDSTAFANALDEVLAPLAQPRYIVPRYIIARPPGFLLTIRRLVTGQVPATVVYHAVPTALAGNKKTAAIFARSWNARVSPGQLLYSNSPEGAGILAVSRGDDPFAITTQIRTLWR
jgi:superfamily II DNA or RNA helicase